jgi:ABC-type uncharacterized transport system ATPase subunit
MPLTALVRQLQQVTLTGEVLERSPLGVKIRVPRVKVADVCRDALASWPVVDLSVEDVSVEEVIRRLFAQAQE